MIKTILLASALAFAAVPVNAQMGGQHHGGGHEGGGHMGGEHHEGGDHRFDHGDHHEFGHDHEHHGEGYEHEHHGEHWDRGRYGHWGYDYHPGWYHYEGRWYAPNYCTVTCTDHD